MIIERMQVLAGIQLNEGVKQEVDIIHKKLTSLGFFIEWEYSDGAIDIFEWEGTANVRSKDALRMIKDALPNIDIYVQNATKSAYKFWLKMQKSGLVDAIVRQDAA
jgi:hypothetical protein